MSNDKPTKNAERRPIPGHAGFSAGADGKIWRDDKGGKIRPVVVDKDGFCQLTKVKAEGGVEVIVARASALKEAAFASAAKDTPKHAYKDTPKDTPKSKSKDKDKDKDKPSG